MLKPLPIVLVRSTVFWQHDKVMGVISDILDSIFGLRKPKQPTVTAKYDWPKIDRCGLRPFYPPQCPSPLSPSDAVARVLREIRRRKEQEEARQKAEAEAAAKARARKAESSDEDGSETLYQIVKAPESPEWPPPVTVCDIHRVCNPRAFTDRIRQGVREVYGGDAVPFYRAARISRSAYSRLISYPDHHPSKETALAMAAALRLDLSAAEAFLRLAGYALSPAHPKDMVWRLCFERGIHDLPTIHALLFQV